MKKILLIVPMLHQGGFERVCIKTARLLQEKCQVTILIFNDADIAYDITGLNIVNLNIGAEDGKIKKLLNVVRRVWSVKKIKRELQIEVSYSFGLTANLVNVLAKAQDQIWVGIRGYLDVNSRIHPILCRRADKIVCCAKMIQQHVQREYPRKDVVTVYNSFDFNNMKELAVEPLQDEEKAFYEGHKVIISVGREDDVKGFWHLIRSFSEVLKTNPDARLAIVGEGTFQEDKAFAKYLGIEDKVLFTGVRKNPFAYVGRASIYALTSISEGFPNSLVEAMALGIPVIATNCPSGPAEILCEDYENVTDTSKIYEADYGILIPEISPVKKTDSRELEPEEELLTQQLRRLLDDEKLVERYRQLGIKRAEQFSEENYVNELVKNM